MQFPDIKVCEEDCKLCSLFQELIAICKRDYDKWPSIPSPREPTDKYDSKTGDYVSAARYENGALIKTSDARYALSVLKFENYFSFSVRFNMQPCNKYNPTGCSMLGEDVAHYCLSGHHISGSKCQKCSPEVKAGTL